MKKLITQVISARDIFKARRKQHARFLLHWLLSVMVFWQSVLVPITATAIGNNKPRPTRSAARLPASSALQGGNSITLFGPQRFDTQAGPARNMYADFMLPAGALKEGVVRIQNGDAVGTNRVTGATLQMNGAVLTTARTLNLNVGSLERSVAFLNGNAFSVRLVGQRGSYVTVTVFAKPLITSFTPGRGRVGEMVTITGDFFDDASPTQNVVRFAKMGGGQTNANVLSATRTQLVVTVPADAATGPLSVQTAGGVTTSANPFEFVAAVPILADFNPKRGPVGTTVVLTGSNLKIGMANPTVTFAGQNGTRLQAMVSSATDTEVRAIVPNAAITGPIELTNTAGKVTTSSSFFVEVPTDYQIVAAPATATTIQGSLANYIVTLTSAQNNFTQLAKMTVQGVPVGSTVTFAPDHLTAGASTTLSLRIAANLAPGSYNFTIRAEATIDGRQEVRTTSASVSVQQAGQTTLTGRVLDDNREPIRGATASLDGKSATTDAAGSFILSGVNAGVDRPVMVDGRTASAPNRTYPVITEPATIVAGQANLVPYDFILPKIDTQYEVDVIPAQTTTVSTPRVETVKLMIPAGANLRNRDGSPVTRVSLTPVAIDRTPAPLPANIGIPIVFTAQPGGAISDVEMPITYPNLTGLDPQTRVPLYNFNHDTVQWYQFGWGRVSADGRTINPEVNPNTGTPYGLRDFSWSGPAPGPGRGPVGTCVDMNCNASPEGEGEGEEDADEDDDDDEEDANGCEGDPINGEASCNSCPCEPNESCQRVGLSSGVKIEKNVDFLLRSGRGNLSFSRIYTSDLGRSGVLGRFGRGTKDSFSISLAGTFVAGGAGRVIRPREGRGQLFSFVRQDADGSLISAIPGLEIQQSWIS